MDNFKDWVKKNGKFKFFLGWFLVATFIAYLLDFKIKVTQGSDWISNISVEFHGLLFDLFLFGIVFTLFESYQNKKNRINSLLDDLDDYRGWNSEEGILKQIGTVYRLLKEGYSKIDLTKTYLHGIDTTSPRFREIKEFKLTSPNKDYSDFFFNHSKLKNVTFNDYYAENVQFCWAKLHTLEFMNCTLMQCYFNKCSSTKVVFNKSKYVQYVEFILGETGMIKIENSRIKKLLILAGTFTNEINIRNSTIDELIIFPKNGIRVDDDPESTCKVTYASWERFCKEIFSEERMKPLDKTKMLKAKDDILKFKGNDSNKIDQLEDYYSSTSNHFDFLSPDTLNPNK